MKRFRSNLGTIVFATWMAACVVPLTLVVVSDYSRAQTPPPQTAIKSEPQATTQPAAAAPKISVTWLLNTPSPRLVPASKSNPVPVVDKFASRAASIERRAALRAYEGAPPVIPHPIAGLNVQTCRACHAEGLKAGDKIAHMASHTYLINCTQCHVEAANPALGDDKGPVNSFVGIRPGGYGGMRAYTGAPPVMPHTVFMRTNCVACHGEFGYDGWRPDHLARTNCIQCHAPAAEFDQLSPAFAIPDLPDGLRTDHPEAHPK